jgi:hypothetical protein
MRIRYFSKSSSAGNFPKDSNIQQVAQWLELVQRLMHVRLTNGKDMLVQSLINFGVFTVKSLYLDL